jgi:hypothetical protein
MRSHISHLTLLAALAATNSCVKTNVVKETVAPAHKKKTQTKVTPAETKLVDNQLSATTQATTSNSANTASSPSAAGNKDTKPAQTADTGTAEPITEDCDTLTRFTDGEPVFLPDNKVIITRVMSPCRTKEGLPGHKKNAGWMAMGFPCTGGEGRIDWKGTNYNRPKMVSFLLETSCTMAPTDTKRIRSEAETVAGISLSAPMIAFNPFVIQYWEVPGYEDADTSFTVDLRSGKGLDDAWVKFIKPKPLKIFLVGRENAWVPGNYMYVVEGELNLASKNRFTMKVETARKLTGDELSKVQGRCESLRPERECGRVF